MHHEKKTIKHFHQKHGGNQRLLHFCNWKQCMVDKGVNGLGIYSTVTVDRCWICDSLPTVCQRFVNSLDINVKTNTIFFKLMKFVNIVLAEYLLLWSILRGDLTVRQYSLTHIPRTRACLEWKMPEPTNNFAQI